MSDYLDYFNEINRSNDYARRAETMPARQVDPLPELEPVCKHPPARLYSWYVGDVLCVCCCKCGAVLHGGAE